MDGTFSMDRLSPEVRADYLDRIRRFTLMDDTFMAKVFEDKKCVELLLRIILEKDLKVERVISQYDLKNLQGRSVRLDIFATDSEGTQYNIEVQRSDEGAIPKRARYNSALMDANLLLAGDSWEQLPESYVIFITEKDVLKGKKPIYTIERTIKELDGVSFGDDSHIIYVNGECKDSSSALGRLMQDFACNTPDKMNYSELADRTSYFKVNKEGEHNMCQIMEELRDKTAAETAAKVARERNCSIALRLLAAGKNTLEEISELTDLPLDEVKKLAENHSA